MLDVPQMWLYVLLWMVSMCIMMYMNYIMLIVSNVHEVSLKWRDAWFLTKCSLLKYILHGYYT